MSETEHNFPLKSCFSYIKTGSHAECRIQQLDVDLSKKVSRISDDTVYRIFYKRKWHIRSEVLAINVM
jgi:hypothetical protein